VPCPPPLPGTGVGDVGVGVGDVGVGDVGDVGDVGVGVVGVGVVGVGHPTVSSHCSTLFHHGVLCVHDG
jgi:hypothetical protein